MPTNFGTGFGPSFGPSFGFSGWNQTWGAGKQQKAPTKQQKFPGLSEEQIKRLESITSDPQQQQKLYKQAIQKLNDQNYKDNRVAAENEMDYRSLNQNDPRQANNMQSRVRLEKLADVTKDKYGLNQDANTKDVIKGLISMAEDKGVDIDQLNKYLQSGDESFLYELGLKENPREKLKDNFWDSLWNNIKTKANIPVDTVKKWGKRTFNEGSEKIYKSLVKKVLGDSAISDMGINLDDYVDTITDKTLSPALKEDSLNYQNQINERYRALSEKNLDQDIENYYNSKGYTEALKEGDFLGFLYKSMGDAAQNREMPAVVAVSIFQPEVGLALMTSDAYARENQEAFENMMENGASYEQAEKGGVVVGLINAMIELFLEKAVGGVETSASRAIRKTMLKNVQEEATKKGLGRIVLEGLGTQLRASGEEGLEEWVQQIVQNAAVKTVNENQKLFEGTREAFEGGFFNIMNLLAGGGNLNQNLQANKSQIRQQVMDGAYTAGVQSRELLDAISNKTQNAENKISGVTDQLYSLDELTKKDIQNNPYSAEVWQRTKNYIQENGRPERSNEVSKALITDVADRVQEKLMAKMKEGGESGRLYKPLLEAGYSVDLSELKSGIDEMLEKYGIKIEDGNLDFSKTAIDGSEASNIKKIYNRIQDTNAPMSLDAYKNRFRQTINDMVDFNQNGRDLAGRKTADTQGDKVLKRIRAAANDLAHNQIPALASLDKTFNERVKTMDEVSDGLVYKDKAKRGVIRDNITQIIKNLDTPNRRELANRLEKLMPGIKEEVRAINMMPKLVDHVYKPSRLQQTITSSAGGIIGTSIGGPVGGIIGAGGGYLLSKWIDKLKSSKWDKVISQTSAEGKAKLTDIQNRIENNEKISQAQKAFLEKIGEELKQGKEKKQGEIAQIIADISSAEDGDVVSVLNNAIDRLETLGAKQEVKEIKGWMAEIQKAMNEKAEMEQVSMDDINQNDNGVLYNDIDPNNPVAEMTREQEIQEEINRIMTPKEAMAIVNTAWAGNNLRDWYDGKYRTGEEWLKGEGARQVEMYATNTLASQKMIESYPELLDGDYSFEDVLDAYLEGTLTGKPQDTADRVDLTQTTNYTPTKLYEPQQIEDVKQTWETANKRVTNSNRDEVYKARGDFVIAAHDPNMVKELGLTDAEVNKKLRDWSAYPAKAKELSNRLNKDVAPEYRWAGLENSSIVKSITTTDADLEKLVKKVEGRSQEYERKYISNTMLALNTHIDWSPLTFNFVKYGELDYTDAYNKKHTPAGIYSSTSDTISISSAGQNTVAHEMGHYLDYLRGRQLFGNDATLSEGGGRNMDRLATEDQVKFVKNFDNFMRKLKMSADMMNDYTITPTEIFARFVARFTEWTRKTATNNRYYYETKWYNDKFIESDYLEFAKLLQEKSKLDLENNYPNYESWLARSKKESGGKETIHEDMLKPLPEKIMKNVKVIGDWKDGGKIYEGVKGELAERLLLSTGEGMVRDAYTFRGEPVDLIWGEYDTDGKAGKGLAKISEKHPSVLGKIQSLLDKLKVKEESSKKIVLGDGSYKLVLRKDYDGEKMNWVLTAYEKE